MKVGVVTFPGSLDDVDAQRAVRVGGNEAVQESLRKLGFAVGGARVGRLVDLEVDATSADEARAQVERMCQELLANPLIESFDVEVAEA